MVPPLAVMLTPLPPVQMVGAAGVFVMVGVVFTVTVTVVVPVQPPVVPEMV